MYMVPELWCNMLVLAQWGYSIFKVASRIGPYIYILTQIDETPKGARGPMLIVRNPMI